MISKRDYIMKIFVCCVKVLNFILVNQELQKVFNQEDDKSYICIQKVNLIVGRMYLRLRREGREGVIVKVRERDDGNQSLGNGRVNSQEGIDLRDIKVI